MRINTGSPKRQRTFWGGDIVERYISGLLAQSTPLCPMWNVERLKRGDSLKWNYIDGCMMNALLKMYERTGEKAYYGFVHNLLDTLVDNEGRMAGYSEEEYNLDNIFSGNALIDVYMQRGEAKFKRSIEKLLSQLEKQPRTTEGSYWHKKIYPNQVWLDGLYMAQVFRASYEKTFGSGSAYGDILRQFRTVREKMFDEDKRLYRHGYDSSKKAFWADDKGLSKNVWLRAVGWYAAALTDVIEAFPEEMTEGRQWLKSVLAELFEGIMPYLDTETGMFLQVVDYPKANGNYPETSGSALIGYAMMKSARLGLAEGKWRRAGMKLFEGICTNYLKESEGVPSLGGICLSAGLGPEDNRRRDGSYEYYISEPVVQDEAKGIAPFLYCCAESLYEDRI